MAETTLFQKILSGEIPGNFIGRGENWAAFLDAFPRADGHTLVVPVNPVQRIAELSKSNLADLFEGVKQVQNTLSAYFETNDFTVIIHDGPMAGQEIPHVHVHVIPRVEGDRGRALPAMFPEANPSNPPDYPGLAELCAKIKEATI
jgi:histidine triad (HIT) family protein|tara:strand:+ start:362 stop:799 length:438 start_codon:yes stop_codon:yes gene_type:complete